MAEPDLRRGTEAAGKASACQQGGWPDQEGLLEIRKGGWAPRAVRSCVNVM